MTDLSGRVSPRARLLGAGALLVGLSALGPLGGMSGVMVARVVLALVMVVGVGGWWLRRGAARTRVPVAERMKVVCRDGLSPRCGVALVEAEGRSFLVTFGDSFAAVHALEPREEVAPVVVAQARRPRPRWRMPHVPGRGRS
ncbi:hypothetical protein LY474_06775 [Myxococcus stipitatus]|uniref:hypothetical protein n=1 Tax=Myxococcus stipitatus TaxID=83455 RepID=UPI001F39EAA8|nr:hypothetical protein [Myxococcus stipitatus]MCE9667515.1 hypothetical protein [Myxococcus stipitatus]